MTMPEHIKEIMAGITALEHIITEKEAELADLKRKRQALIHKHNEAWREHRAIIERRTL